MVIKRFPAVETADEHGLLAIGGDLEPESVLLAYQNGIFPWPLDEETLAWFAPSKRAVIFLDHFHCSRRLKRSLKNAPFVSKRDHDFEGVIHSCAEVVNRGEQKGTWITPEMIDAYCALFELGFCHSFETYLDNQLVGGLYGIRVGRFFSAESGFFRAPDASKAAMCDLVQYLATDGIEWFDCQVLTPFSQSFGAQEIARSDYMKLLSRSLDTSVKVR